jgi:diaminopimelate epimerase
VAVALFTGGRTDAGEVSVRMPGGVMKVTVDDGLDVVLRGPVEEVCTGELTEAMLRGLAE